MKKMLKAAAVLAAMVMALTLGACSDGSSGDSGPSARAQYESSDGDVLTFYDDDTFVLAGSSKAAAVARAIGRTITGTYKGDPVSGDGLELTANDGTEIPVSGSGGTLTITVDGTAYLFTKKSGGGGNTPNTPSSKNPFGFTEEDSGKFFCLDKDGKVLQEVEDEWDGEDVEGTVFVVYWRLIDGRGKVELRKCYGDYEDVTIPDGVTEIGASAFSGCTSLASVTIPDGVTEIGGAAFQWCTSLASVTIPDGVTEIGGFAFWGCSSLASVTIPSSVTKIDGSAFMDCTSLASVTIPDGVTTIDGAFKGCTSLASVSIGNGVTEIGGHAFEGCTSLASVTIPGSVTKIGESAFEGCTSLASVTIPGSVTEIRRYAFMGCSKLTSVTFIEQSGWHADVCEVTYSGYDIEDMSDPRNNATYLRNTSAGSDKDWGARRLYRE